MATHKVQGVTQILKLDLFSNTNIKGIIKLYKFQIRHISYKIHKRNQVTIFTPSADF